jgi:hypothetical protein
VLSALPVPAASAGTIDSLTFDCAGDDRECNRPVLYRAAAGERNEVTYSLDATGTTVHDAGAPVTPLRGCVAVDANTARCGPSPLSLELGDGDDRAAPASGIAAAASIAGGAGDDVLTGSDGDDRLVGDEGTDTLLGGAGDDHLLGGTGKDVLDGGAGTDSASYFGEQQPVVVDLAAGLAPDTLGGIEGVLGTLGADVLRGDDGPNTLQGGGGDDVVEGRGGNDVVDGGTGFDRLDGGAGDDELVADSNGGSAETERERDRTGEPLACGPGADLVSEQARDVLSDCERLELPLGILAPEFDPRPVIRGRTAVLRPRCAGDLRAPGGCRVRVTLAAGGRVLGRRTSRIAGRATPVRVPLHATGFGALRVELRYLGRVGTTEARTTIYRYRLSGPAPPPASPSRALRWSGSQAP